MLINEFELKIAIFTFLIDNNFKRLSMPLNKDILRISLARV